MTVSTSVGHIVQPAYFTRIYGAMEKKEFIFSGPEPQRLDQFLCEQLEGMSRNFVQKLIASQHVSIEGRKVKPSLALRGGERISISIPPPSEPSAEPEDYPLYVLYEDADLLVVNKEAGMVVHPSPGHEGGTLVNAVLAHCGDLSGVGGVLRPGIVHRLDAGTSGALVVAKNDTAHNGLARQFKSREIVKIYKAVVYGNPTPAEGEIDVPIGRDRKDRKKISSSTNAPRSATTRYTMDESWGEVALLTVRMLTGRTHQIRVHCNHIGHPLVGDSLYGGGGARRKALKNPRLRSLIKTFARPALHAWKLGFQHPATGERMSFEAPLPADLIELMESLRAER